MDFSPTLVTRFWKYVDTSGGPDACWPWTGNTQERRGGRLVGRIKNYNGARPSVFKAHRVALAIETGTMEDADAMHSCDNPICCNARHLSWGSHSSNMKEQHERHPQPRRPEGTFAEKESSA